jgi:hypothetical protein
MNASLHDTAILRQFRRSVDLLDLGEAIASVGSSLTRIGRHIVVMNEPPAQEHLDQLVEYATRILAVASQLRQIK